MRIRICRAFFVLVVAVVCATAAHAQDTLQTALRAKFEADLSHVAQQLNGVMGFAIKDLATGDGFFLHPDTVFPQASSIKLTVLLELLRQDQAGKLSLDEKHTILRREMTVGDDEPIITMLGDGTVTMSLRDLATFMVVLSDNSATNILIDRVGMENVNAEIARLGLKQTKLRRHMIDLEAAKRGDENVSTPREMLTLLEKIHAGGVLDAAHTQEYFRLLRLPKPSTQSEFHNALPPNVPIADKPGELEAVRCDTGLIDIPGHPFVLSVMTTYNADDRAGQHAIEDIARLAYSYFSRLSRASSYGRIISEK